MQYIHSVRFQDGLQVMVYSDSSHVFTVETQLEAMFGDDGRTVVGVSLMGVATCEDEPYKGVLMGVE